MTSYRSLSLSSGPLKCLRPHQPQAFTHWSLFLFLQANLTSLEEAGFLFLEHLGQHTANEHKKQKEGVSHTVFESFLLEAQLVPTSWASQQTHQAEHKQVFLHQVRLDRSCLYEVTKPGRGVTSHREHTLRSPWLALHGSLLLSALSST